MNTQEILQKASIFFGNSQEEIVEKVRYGHIIQIRQFICKLARVMNQDDTEIGIILNTDRTTVINAIRRADYLYENNKDFHDSYDEFRNFVCPNSGVHLLKTIFPGQTELVKMTVSELSLVRQRLLFYDDELKHLIRKTIQR